MSARADLVPRVSQRADRWRRVRAGLGVLVLALALGAVVHVIRAVGLWTLVEVVLGAGPLALCLVLFELAMMVLEALAARALVATTGPTAARGAIVAYALAQLMPGGRVLGELARATHVAQESGAGRATHAAVVVQGTYVACVACALALGALVLPDHDVLRALLAAGAGWNLGIAMLFLAAPRSVRVMSVLARRLGVSVPSDEPPAWQRWARAAALTTLSRVAHIAQAGLAVWLVTRCLDAHGAFAAESLQLLASTAGDAIPGQAGVLEATFHSFASTVSPSDASLAVGVALLLRAARLGLLAPLAIGYWAAGLAASRTLGSPVLAASVR